MKIIGIIMLVILGISLLLLTCAGLYALWFMAFPEFINKLKNKPETFKEIRCKYGYIGLIELIDPEYGGDYGYVIYYKPNHLAVDHWNKGFNTYEEAEVACIKKLLEIVEPKDGKANRRERRKSERRKSKRK